MPILILLLLGFVILLPAGAIETSLERLGCEAAGQAAVEIHDLRDVDAGEGATRGMLALDALRASGESCPLGEVKLLRAIAANLHILGQFEQALSRIDRALALLDDFEIDDPGIRAGVHLTAGTVHWDLESQDKALVHYQASVEASEAAGDLLGAGRAAGSIGNLYNTTGNLERARQSHELALALFTQAEWDLGIAGTLVNLAALAGRAGDLAERNNDFSSAQEDFTRMRERGLEALEQFEALGNARGVAHAATNIATAMERLGNPEQALAYLQQAMEIQRSVGDIRAEFQLLTSLARTHLQLGNHDQAARLLSEAAERIPEGNLPMSLVVAERRVELETDRGDLAAALQYQQEVTALNREIAASQMAVRVEEVRMAMEAEQREQELELLRREAQISELRYDQQRVILLATVLAAGLLVVLLIFLYGRYRQRVETSRQLDVVSRTDPLTGLPNRRDMIERLTAAHAGCVDSGKVCGLVMADVDRFKQINDEYGHDVGDEVLRQLADVLRESVKGRDVVARWGGEEFLLLLPDTDLAGSRSVAENLRQIVDGTRLDTAEGRFEVTLTLGVTVLDGKSSVDEAIRRADQAMYRGKHGGGNRTESQSALEPG